MQTKMKRMFLLLAAMALFGACSPDAEGIDDTPKQEEPGENPGEDPGDEPDDPEDPNDPEKDPGDDPENPEDPEEDPGDEPVDPETAAARVAALCERLNENLVLQHALIIAGDLPDCITKVVPIASGGEIEGYTFAFKQNKPITLYPDLDYKWPDLVPRFDSNVLSWNSEYCWKVDGEWLFLADETMPVLVQNESGTAPRLKVEHGYWHITCDDGRSWWPLGPAPDGQTELPPPPTCRWIEEEADYWIFGICNPVFAFSIPKEGTLHVDVDTQEELIFTPGQTHTVYFTVTGGSYKTVVTAELENPDGSYNITVDKNSVGITANVPTANKVIVTVTDGTRTATTAIAVTLKPLFSDKVITVVTPGTLAALLEELSADYDILSTTELTIIGNLNEEDLQALKGLPNLAVLDLENVNMETLPTGAFSSKKTLTSIKLPKTLKTIGQFAFTGCSSLVDITIPESVTKIGWMAFEKCSSLTDIIIPESVTSIGNCAFWYCRNLTNVTILGNVTSIKGQTFEECTSLTNVTLPESVTEISNKAFSGCSSLASINIPKSVTTIGTSAFANCSNLTDFSIPENVTKIGERAFYGCPGSASLTIPAGVTEIGEWAFYAYPSSNLEKVYCKAAVPPTCVKSPSSVLSQVTVFANEWTATLYVPAGTAEAYKAADGWKEFKNINEMEF